MIKECTEGNHIFSMLSMMDVLIVRSLKHSYYETADYYYRLKDIIIK